ncbi:MAG: hypothetical protein HOY79_49380 [Streptomyces sp.]|nr:hypothetical protein [Streptomyces sp.]
MSYDETHLNEDDPSEDELQDAEEWQEGTCDMCLGSTLEDLVHAAEPGALIPVCACAIGQGAPPDECRCGPEGD